MNYDLTLCNRTLSLLGQRAITSIDENSVAAREIKLHYAPSVRSVIRSHDWACLNTERPLALLHGEKVSGWQYLYQRPADCKSITDIYADAEDIICVPGRYDLEKFEQIVSPKSKQRAIATNIKNALLKYTSDGTDSSLYDENLQDAIVAKLAWAACHKITGSKNMQASQLQEFNLALDEAKFQDKADKQEKYRISNPMKKARSGGAMPGFSTKRYPFD
ncbi:hypothetical protein Dip510_000829 [Elusimicrobium posterum]|uniref:hypothetical protein n=1 Tax=Elusimicrobium posterum TaxID=3116653 RepID=UPI003C72479C